MKLDIDCSSYLDVEDRNTSFIYRDIVVNMELSTELCLINAEFSLRLNRFARLLAGVPEMFRTAENWWDVFELYLGIRNRIVVKFRGLRYPLTLTKENWKDYLNLRRILLSKNIQHIDGNGFRFSHIDGLKFDYDKVTDFHADASQMQCYLEGKDILCEVEGLKFLMPFPFGAFELDEIFVQKTYGEPDCSNMVVVDVGAFIGDSAVFYANRGAKSVIAFEPVPFLFDFLKKNVVINGFEDVVQTRNQAIGNALGTVKIRFNPIAPGLSKESSSGDSTTIQVQSTPLSLVISEFEWIDVLKIDCEGCEHKVLRHMTKAGGLKKIGTIVMEVHGDIRNVVNLLRRADFKLVRLKKLTEDRWVLVAKSKNVLPS